MKVLLLIAFVIAAVSADLYMHNPRGSNCRLNENNTNRQQGNRLMDTQNNAKGGYCVGPAMSYYEGSSLSIEWTNQHGCGNPKLECNLVIQYMCGAADAEPEVRIRDGTTTNRIPNDDTFTDEDENGELLYGMHESRTYYQACATRERNMGLFIADRAEEGNLNGQTARFTRQNNNGGRNGFECAEERDYYPYWHPSPWKDIAILIDDSRNCDMFTAESQNVKSKFHCVNEEGTEANENNEAACLTEGNQWVEVPSHGIPAPDCLNAPWNRDNHLGNGANGFQSSYNWTLPTADQEDCIGNDNCNCVLRMRYNISTTDLDGWGFDDSTKNAANSPVQDDPVLEEAGLKLALDTSQFGRTFQDRSHVFHIRPRPDGVGNLARIFNLNVRGKRGNIVQAYPATEYDFVPTFLEARVNDYIHFQWTGCDTNPAGNAGEGTAGTDRSNIVQIADNGKNYPVTEEWLNDNDALFESKDLRDKMSLLGQTNCPSYEKLLEDNDGNEGQADQDENNCYKLNAADRYFDGGLIKMNKTGTFHYMSSRNNNFTNRGQKGTIVVSSLLPTWAIAVVVAGAVVFVGSAGLAGAMFYAKTHPHSGLAETLSKL